MTGLILPVSKFFSKFSGEATALFLYLVIPKTDRLEAAAAAGLTRAAFIFGTRSPAFQFSPIREVQFAKWQGRPERENHAQDARATSSDQRPSLTLI